MAKKKKADEPKRSHHKQIKLPLPVPPDFHAEELPVVIVESLVIVDPPCLPAPVEMTDCILAISETFWQGNRIVGLLAPSGHELPAALKTGQRVKVQFFPMESEDPLPPVGEPPYPHD